MANPMTDKHTPGRVVLFDPADGEDGVLVCECTFQMINRQVRFTYCPLHAAAPELLEALEDLYYWILQDYPLGAGEPQPRLAKARAVVKAAKGD